MKATWRPLASWPYPQRPQQHDQFRSAKHALDWDHVLQELEWELERNDADDVLIGVVADPSKFTIGGQLRAGARATHPGAEVSFDHGGQRITFHTDAYDSLQSNLRAITLGLAALRAVDRYGITSGREQWAGFAQLTAGGPDVGRGRLLVERAGSIRAALMEHHPDRDGDPAKFADVVAYRDSLGGGQLTRGGQP